MLKSHQGVKTESGLNLAADPAASAQAEIEKTAARWIAERRKGIRSTDDINRDLATMDPKKVPLMIEALNKYRQIKPVSEG